MALPANLPALTGSRRDLLKTAAAVSVSLAGGGLLPSFASAAERKRWYEQPYRIVQTNLREIDVRENPAEIARALRDFGASAMVSNIGGIVAFYPTKLPYHYKNPYLTSDFVGEMREAAHANGLAYVGRFDVTKGMGAAYKAHPEWFVLNRDGNPREYAGTYQACPNGGWAQQYVFEIFRESLTRYEPDGLFFNGGGYPRTNYSGVDEGICVCDNCRRRFRSMYGLELPAKDGPADPNWNAYNEFRFRTSMELVERMNAAIRKLRPNVPLMDYRAKEDIGRGEAQRRVDRTGPEWPYQAGEQTRSALASNPGKPYSPTSAAHIDYPWRQVTENAAAHMLRMTQSLALGGQLDLYLMGTLANQDDQTWLPAVSRLYKWHAANAQHYAGLAPAMRVAIFGIEMMQPLAVAAPWAKYASGAYRGIYSALVDARLPFWMISDERLAKAADPAAILGDFDVIVLPHTLQLSNAQAAALDAWVARGGLLIATGMAGGYDERGAARSAMPLASSPVAAFGTPIPGRGFSLDDEGAKLDFGGARIPIDGHYFPVTPRAGAVNLIPFAPEQRYGPPELSYALPGAKPRSDPGALVMSHGKGHSVHIPWLPDWQYYRDGLDAHRELFAAIVARYAPAQPFVLTGDGAVEMTVQRQAATRRNLVHLINYGGQRGARYGKPPMLQGLRLSVGAKVSPQARALVGGREVTGTRDADGRLWFDLPPIGDFEVLQFADA